MLFRFASYCRNQQFVRQIIRKPFTPFCLSNQNIQQHINTLIELGEKFQARDEIEKDEQLKLEISKYENDLDSYLTKFMVHQREPYYQFRKHLIQLAYKTYFINETMSIKYIESAMCGDYENHYKDELMKQVFLAELYGIKLRIKYSGQEEEFAAKSLAHWQNVLENHCQFYKQWKENQSFDIDAFTKNKEVVYYDQYLECYVAIQQELYLCGSFQKQKTYFEEAQTKIEEAIKIILYLKEKIAEMKGAQLINCQEFVKKYESKFNKHLVNSYISLIKTFIFERKTKYGKELLEKILKKNIANSIQRFHLKMLEFNLDRYFLKNLEQFDEIISSNQFKLKNILETQEQIEKRDKQMVILQYYLFIYEIMKKFEEDKEIEQIIYLDSSLQMELYFRKFEKFIIYLKLNDLQELSQKCMNLLVERKYTKHYFWDSVIFSFLFAVYREKDVEFLQIKLHSIQNTILPIIERPQEKIVEFFQLIVELEMKSEINQVDQDILQKIEQIEFEQPLIKYQKKLALEKIYKTYKLKQDQIQKNN